MTTPSSDAPIPDGPAPDDEKLNGESSPRREIHPRQRIQHELVRVRREAEAARLEANAARLEASAANLQEMLERIDAGHDLSATELKHLGLAGTSPNSFTPSNADNSTPATVSAAEKVSAHAAPSQSLPRGLDAPSTSKHFRFQSWDEVSNARNHAAQNHAASNHETPTRDAPTQDNSRVEPPNQPIADSPAILRTDSAHPTVRRPRQRSTVDIASEDAAPFTPISTEAIGKAPVETPAESVDLTPDQEESERATDELETAKQTAEAAESAAHSTPALSSTVELDQASDASENTPAATGSDLPIELLVDDESEPTPARRHPIPLVLSAIVHVIIVLLLMMWTLSTAMPKDQVALSASTSESAEEAIETFQMESVESTVDPSETAPDETQYDVSPLGEMAKFDVTSDLVSVTAPAMASMQSFSKSSNKDSQLLKSMKSDSSAKMQFCGVEGGGNHFVYLVDSSGSMGDAFVSARRALLDSINMLSEKQRFYVIFFDAQCDYMRISRADEDEPRSVYATTDNKSRLKAWAMRVAMDRGKAPYEPLQFALEKLKPDVIFLLSDGEFPQRIESVLMESNRVSNLFGEETPISIIHTISYHSREGESRMRRIAENHFGQYRHIPKPGK
ncbi:vWA domain-containing protein [Neorhodopirellula lusitana]|uniref:vWA domain-containing protein n=1 Tax=Neorhodopirellula lusitana TaxID=445327 RepID=UPI00384E2DA0